MQNPFESGHIKNYLLLYASIVVIMVLFFVASSLFHDVENVDRKTFNTTAVEISSEQRSFDVKVDVNSSNKFKLLPQNN